MVAAHEASPARRLTNVSRTDARSPRGMEAIILAVRSRDANESETEAIARVAPGLPRSTFLYWRRRYDRLGSSGLERQVIKPPPRPRLSDFIREAIIILRKTNPMLSAAEIAGFIFEHHQETVSETIVKRTLKEANLAHRPGPKSKQSNTNKREQQVPVLRHAGAKLLEAADVALECSDTLAQAIVAHVKELPQPEILSPADTSGRDEAGRFTADYNARYRKGPDDAVGPGFASVEEKRKEKEFPRLHMHRHSLSTMGSKLRGLMFAPVLGGCGSWEGMRTADGAELVHLCGKSYMPSTLDLYARELKYSGASATLWQVYAEQWTTLTSSWGDPKFSAVAYADATTKPLWTKYFSHSTKVSSLNRVMPGIETIAIHNGYGVPVYQVSCSGRAPLVKNVPVVLKRLESMLSAPFSSIVVIDSEGNSVPFVRGLESEERGWVTRMRPSMLKGCEDVPTAWSPAQPFRTRETVQERSFELHDAQGDALLCRLLKITHPKKEFPTYIACSILLATEDWPTTDVAALYLSRWPNQEANFRAVNQALNSKQMHGYGKQRVQNITVTTKLEQLTKVQDNATHRLEKLKQESAQKEQEHELAQQEVAQLSVVDARLGAFTEQRAKDGQVGYVAHLRQEQLALHQELARSQANERVAQQTAQESAAKVEQIATKIEARAKVKEKLSNRTEVYQHDTELDSIFNVLQLSLYMLTMYVLRALMNGSKMAPKTFLERFCSLQGTQVVAHGRETIRFSYNTRDPEMMTALLANYKAINAKNLKLRSGNVLRIEVAPDPRKHRKK
jgi:hypothetical protein